MKPHVGPTLVAVLVLVAVTATGCQKKAPVKVSETPAEAPARQAAAPAPQPAAAPARPAPAEDDIWSRDIAAINEYVRSQGLLKTVYFDYDRSELRPDTREALAANARFLAQRPELVVTVEGHADERGTAEYNLALGESRSNTVTGYLSNLGVGRDRLQTLTLGEERPLCFESGENCWWKNRRAEFVVVGRRG